jgi:probable F420-dependent oxidoreductase
MDFGDFGAWTSYRRIGKDNAGEAARAVEAAGLGTLWLGGSPRLEETRPLLEASEKLVVGTSIVNIWGYDPADLVREYAALEADFPGRLCVGIGVGHPEATNDYKRPLTNLEAFLDGIDAAAEPIPTERRIVAALGPKMLTMSARRSLGTIPYFTSVDHTRFARKAVGPERSSSPRSPACSTRTPSAPAPPRASTRRSTWASATTRTRCSNTASIRPTSRTAAPIA